MSNNIEIADSTFAGIPKGKMLDLSHNRFGEIIPNFPEIPLGLMEKLERKDDLIPNSVEIFTEKINFNIREV